MQRELQLDTSAFALQSARIRLSLSSSRSTRTPSAVTDASECINRAAAAYKPICTISAGLTLPPSITKVAPLIQLAAPEARKMHG
jgi:hypothetical protein